MFAIGQGLLVLRTLGFYFITPGDDVPKKVFLFDITNGIISGVDYINECSKQPRIWLQTLFQPRLKAFLI